jgi:alpha-mannosidase
MKIHLIPNSHMDPVWLWNKYEGIDEVLNTFRSACDRMDEFPNLTFSASSVQFYVWVKKYDKVLFQRIREFVSAGRWEISGGWWVEPDSNLPMEISFRKHAELSKKFMLENFNCETKVAFLPDTFGHPATLPKILSETGFKYFVFCRPSMDEKSDLPSNLFYWEYDGYKILAYRLKNHYTQRGDIDVTADHEYASTPINGYFFGIGNHGGGPTIKEIEYYNNLIRENPYVKLHYSTCRNFFEDAETNIKNIPTYSGDLHMHAVGCYSVLRNLKQKIRTSEHSLAKLERIFGEKEIQNELYALWEKVLFNQFHDILPGSCSQEAEADAINQLGGVISKCEDLIYDKLKKESMNIPVKVEEGELRIYNSLPYKVRKPIQFEFSSISYNRTKLFDSNGNKVLKQEILPDVKATFAKKWEFIDTIPANGFKSYSFDIHQKTNYDDKQFIFFNQTTKHSIDIADKISFLVFEDNSDTWSHGIRRYNNLKGTFTQKSSSISKGPISEKLYKKYSYNRSYLDIVYSKYYELPGIYLDIRLNWSEHRTVLKMELNLGNSDKLNQNPKNQYFIMQGANGAIKRKADGSEMPMHHWIWCKQNKAGIALIQDGAFACDCLTDRLRINLVRSSLYGFHDPYNINKLEPESNTDQGIHSFKFLLLPETDFNRIKLDKQADIFLEKFFFATEGFIQKKK